MKLVKTFLIILLWTSLLLKAEVSNKNNQQLKNQYLVVQKMVNTHGMNNSSTLNAYYELGALLQESGNYEEAKKIYEKTIPIDIKMFGESNKNIAISYSNYANCFQKTKMYDKAIELYKKSVDISIKAEGRNNAAVALFYHVIGSIYYKKNEYNQSVKYYEKSINIRKSINQATSIDIINTYINIGHILAQKSDFDKALSFYNKASTIEILNFGENSPKLIEFYNYIGMTYYQKNDFDQALDIFNKALRINLAISTKNHPSLISLYTSIGSILAAKGQYTKALEFLNKALTLQLTLTNKNPLDTLSLYNSIGSTWGEKGNFDKALEFFYKSIEIINNDKEIKYNSLVITTYANIGSILHEKGNYNKALKFSNYALNLQIKLLGKNTLLSSTMYNTIGMIWFHKGEANKALEFLNKALNIKLKLFGRDSINTAMTYGNITQVYLAKKEFEKAITVNQKILKIFIEKLGQNHKYTITIYNNLGEIYLSTKEYNKSLDLFSKALKLISKEMDKNNPMIPSIYGNMANVYVALNNTDMAIEYYYKAINKFDNSNSHLSLIPYTALGTIFYNKKEYDKSILLYTKALKYAMENYSNKHFLLGEIYQGRAMCFYQKHMYKKAYSDIYKSFHIYLDNKDRNFIYLDTKEKYAYSKSSRYGDLATLFTIANLYKEEVSKSEATKIVQVSLNDWLNYKGTIFESENLISMVYNKTTDRQVKQDIAKLNILKAQLSNLYQFHSIDKVKQVKNSEDIKKLEQIYHDTQVNLSKKSSSFKQLLALQKIGYRQISNSLKQNQLYIDFVKGFEQYYIFTIDNKQYISFEEISIADSKIIEKNIRNFRVNNYAISNTLKNKIFNHNKVKETLSVLYGVLIEKYLSNIKNKTSLIISPDGLLNVLPFEALYHNGKYLIEDYDISYISSGREFVRQTKRQKANPKYEMICFENPDFNSSLPIAETKFMSDEQVTLDTWEQYKNFSPIGDDEIKTIRRYYPNALIYEKKNATTSNLMRVESSKILHFSTHGKFLTNSTLKNPMLKAGLALAGANKPNSDGIVTALKLSALDLKNTELVVLSACESGLGDIQNSEGVMGLPKAFLQAGAREVIMSLWSVSTLGTAELMEHFYENVHRGQSYATALRNAKIKMIKEKQHPYYWSAFILHGISK